MIEFLGPDNQMIEFLGPKEGKADNDRPRVK